MTTNKDEFQNVTGMVSRRDALKLGDTLLVAAAAPWPVRAEEDASVKTSSAASMPEKLTAAQRDGITGKTADLGNGY